MRDFDDFITSARMGPGFQEQIEAMESLDGTCRDFRKSSITVRSLKERNPLEVLSILVQCWPCRDVRASYSYEEDDDLQDTSDGFITDVAKGLDLRESKRSLKSSSVVFDIMLQDNLDTFEDYNESVDQHNTEWLINGANLYDFDPVTGDESRLRDTYVDIVEPTSMHHQQLKNDVSSGSLTKRAPGISRSSYGTLEYRVSTQGNMFTLGYVVTSREGYLLCYNELSGTDLSKIVRRTVQEIWGNFKVTGYTGPFYEGISQLFKGTKVKVCVDRHNILPKWCENKKAKVATGDRESSSLFFFTLPIFRHVLPFLLFVYGILWLPFSALLSNDGSYLFTRMVIAIILIISSHKVSDLIEFTAKTKELSDRIS